MAIDIPIIYIIKKDIRRSKGIIRISKEIIFQDNQHSQLGHFYLSNKTEFSTDKIL